ncbi:hypothetical protein BG844_08385 [Couchioplanes caeruleus subsp. caeruleus]|uniref:Uncharacterized protein n=2 Tax=Couchioplanes caeruleus TaxID=56438 RepID=A0A1K0GBN4_9ACTN|nr:hypothetical protein BG844_08385 [Couchioplanes caeruleus subsp. caeruleus]
MQSQRRSVQLACLLMVAGVVSTGCAARTKSPSVAPPPPSPPAVSLDGPVRDITAEEAELLELGEQTLLKRCLERAGFQWTIEAPVAGDRDFPYVLDDVAWARAHGYGSDVREEIRRARESDANRRYTLTLTPERRQAATEALNGDLRPGRDAGVVSVRLPNGMVVRRSEHGCQAEAERALYGDLTRWTRVRGVVSVLKDAVRQRVLGDARYTAAVTRWSRCMAAAGHRYASPADTRGAFADTPATGPSRTRELVVAQAEATCATKTDLSATAAKLSRHYTDALNAEHRADVDLALRLRVQALLPARTAVDAQP